MSRRRCFGVALILLVVCMLAFGTGTAEFDVGQYTYEELTEIKQLVDARLEELNRQYAIEHADRTFSFAESEQVVFIGRNTEQQPDVTIISEEAPAKTQFIWSTSDDTVATVSTSGRVTAVAAGDAVITAAAEDNPYLTVSYTVHAAIPVEQITIWGPTDSLVLSNEPEEAIFDLGVSIEPEDAYYQEVTWASSNEEIITVDEAGHLQALQPGQAVISAVSTEIPVAGKKAIRAEYKVNVIQAVTSLECAQNSLKLNVGETATVAVNAIPENASNKKLTFTSSDPEVATVDERGTVKTMGCGECDILCEAADGFGASVNIHVRAVKMVSKILIDTKQITMPIGSSHTIEAVVNPEDATDPTLLWTSSNVFVARVAGGKVEAVGQGDCVISCISMDGSNITVSVKVHVPTFSVEAEAYSVTEKQGMVIPVVLNQKNCKLEAATESAFFTVTLNEAGLKIDPVAAGSGVVTLMNPEAPEDTIQIQVTIENSAVFNQTSYPPIAYTELVKAPALYEKAQISIFGKVIHISEEEEKKILMLGTGGDTYTDQVIRVNCDPALLPEDREITEGEMMTIYGLFYLDHYYSEILQAETVVPALEAEKIVIGE